VQNCGINPDFDLFLKRKSGGPSPRVVDHPRVVGPQVHRGPHSGRRPELTGARPSSHSGHDDLPRKHGRQKGGAGTLVPGSPWAKGRRGGLAAVGSKARRRRSVCEALRERRWREGSEDKRGGVGQGAGRVL
jgi:hypothetical protein